MIHRKRFSKEMQERLVMEVVAGQSSVAHVAQREGINPQTIRNWKRDLGSGSFQSDHEVEILLRKRIAELESALADSALTVHILKKTEHYLKEMKRKEKLSGSISPQNSVSPAAAKRSK